MTEARIIEFAERLEAEDSKAEMLLKNIKNSREGRPLEGLSIKTLNPIYVPYLDQCLAELYGIESWRDDQHLVDQIMILRLEILMYEFDDDDEEEDAG